MADQPEDVLSDPGRRSPLIVVVVVVLVVAVVSWFVSRTQPPPDQTARSTEAPTPLISPVGPSYASTGPTFAPTDPCPTVRSTTASPSGRARVSDGRVRAGRLSYAVESSFRDPVRSAYPPFATQVSLQARIVFANSELSTPGWTAVLAVGRLRVDDGFIGPGLVVAQQVLSCLIESDRGRDPVARVTATRTIPIQSGAFGTALDADVTLTSESSFPGERVSIVVVPDDGSWDLFLATVPIGSVQLDDVADRALASLRVS